MPVINATAFTVFGVAIKWYGILIAVGMLLAVLLCMRRERAFGLPKDTSINVALLALPVAIICARLYYVAFDWSVYRDDPMQIFAIREGGLAIYGGIIGGVAAGFLYARVKKISFTRLLDLTAPAIALGQGIGRWGNFINQEAYGNAVRSDWMGFFPFAVYIDAYGKWFYATFFYESAWCILICVLLLVLEKRHVFRRAGDQFGWYVLLYAAERLVVENLRTDSLYFGSLRVSQLLSILAMGVVFALFFRRAKKTLPACLLFAAGFAASVLSAFSLLPQTTALLLPCALIMLLGAVFCYRSGRTTASD